MECSICLSPITENQYMTNCNHIFHKTCLENWLSNDHMNCPMCRQRINYCDSEDLERVKFIIIKQNIQIPPGEIRLTYDKTKLCIVSFTCTILGALFYLWDNIYMTDDCINNE